MRHCFYLFLFNLFDKAKFKHGERYCHADILFGNSFWLRTFSAWRILTIFSRRNSIFLWIWSIVVCAVAKAAIKNVIQILVLNILGVQLGLSRTLTYIYTLHTHCNSLTIYAATPPHTLRAVGSNTEASNLACNPS